MKQKAFTLVEVIISVILLGIIVALLYESLQNTQKANQIFLDKKEHNDKEKKIINVLYEDILEADEIRITGGKKFKAVELKTNNSLFDIIKPQVIWFVSKKDDTLVRVESSKLPLSYENRFTSHISKIQKDCETFSVYQSNKKDKILIYIRFKGKQPIIYEFYKPM